MKRILFLTLSILALCSTTFAGGITDKHKEVTAKKKTAIGASPCPSFYASAIFSWDGDHTSGTNYGCETDGDAVQGTNSGLQIDTDNGESGSNGALVDSLNEYLTWTDSGDQYIDDDSEQTIWMRVYISEAVDDDTSLFESWIDGENRIILLLHSTDTIWGVYEADNTYDSTTAGSFPTGSWTDIAISWDYTEDDFSAYEANGGWVDDTNEGFGTMISDLDDITIGENATNMGPAGTGIFIRITQFAIVSGYKTAVPW